MQHILQNAAHIPGLLQQILCFSELIYLRRAPHPAMPPATLPLQTLRWQLATSISNRTNTLSLKKQAAGRAAHSLYSETVLKNLIFNIHLPKAPVLQTLNFEMRHLKAKVWWRKGERQDLMLVNNHIHRVWCTPRMLLGQIFSRVPMAHLFSKETIFWFSIRSKA